MKVNGKRGGCDVENICLTIAKKYNSSQWLRNCVCEYVCCYCESIVKRILMLFLNVNTVIVVVVAVVIAILIFVCLTLD